LKRFYFTCLALSLVLSTPLSSYGESNLQYETEDALQSAWSIAKEVDEFGDVIEDSDNIFLKSTAEGDFSNTATAKSDLLVIIDNTIYNGHHVFGFTLYEYGNTPATYSSNSEITLKTKVNDTITGYTLYGDAPNSPVFLGATNTDGDELFNTLYAGYDVRCIIYIDNSQYNFTISSSGYQEVCAEAQQKLDAINEKNRVKDISSVVNSILSSEDGAAKLLEAYDYLISSREDYALMSDEDIKNEIDGDFYYSSLRQYKNNGIIITSRYIMNYSGNKRTQKLYWQEGISDVNPKTQNTEGKFEYADGIITSSYHPCQVRKMADGYYVAYESDGTDYTIPCAIIMKGHQDSTGFVFDYPLPEQ